MAKVRIEREYGLIYVDKEDKSFLYKSYFTLDNLITALETDITFKDIEKKEIKIAHLTKDGAEIIKFTNVE